MRNKYGAIVIGGGYFGCACSYFFWISHFLY